MELFIIKSNIKLYVPGLKLIFFSKYLTINLSNVTMGIGFKLPLRYSILYKYFYINKYGIMDKQAYDAFMLHAICYKYSNRLELEKYQVDYIFKNMLMNSKNVKTPIIIYVLTKLLGGIYWKKN